MSIRVMALRRSISVQVSHPASSVTSPMEFTSFEVVFVRQRFAARITSHVKRFPTLLAVSQRFALWSSRGMLQQLEYESAQRMLAELARVLQDVE